jgi:hypothetical protein
MTMYFARMEHFAKTGVNLLVGGSFLLATVRVGEATVTATPTQPYGMTAASATATATGPAPGPTQPFSQAAAPTPEMLQQLVAPIALYPDELVAEILAASAWPDQIVAADHFLQQHPDLQGTALAQAVDPLPWDESVKALVAFPSVLRNMDQNMAWTKALGQAHANDPQAVLNAVQGMRQRAQACRTLQTTPQQTVRTEGQTITIEPVNPQVVYVPQYDPWLVYGAPVPVYPYWDPYPGLYLGAPGFVFGLGIGIGLFAGFGWGWGHWGADWHHGWLLHDNHVWGPMAGRGFGRGVGGFGPGGFHGGPGGGFRPGAGGFAGHGGPMGAGHAGPAGFGHPGPVGAGHAVAVGGHVGSAGGFHSGGGVAGGGFHGGLGHASGFHGGGFAAGGFHGGGFHGGGFHGGGFHSGGFHGGGFHGGGFHGGGHR